MSKLFGSFLGISIALMLLWQFLPFIALHIESVLMDQGLGDIEIGALGLIPLIVVIIIVLGSAAVIRSKFKSS